MAKKLFKKKSSNQEKDNFTPSPKKRLLQKMKDNPKRTAIIIIALLFVGWAFGDNGEVNKNDSTPKVTSEESQSAKQTEIAEKKKKNAAEKEKKKAEAEANRQALLAQQEQDKAAAAEQFKAELYPQLQELYLRFDNNLAAQKAAFDGMGNGYLDIYTGYSQLKDCMNTSRDLSLVSISAPAYLKGEAKKSFREIIENINYASSSNQSGLEKVLEGLDEGNLPPSVVEEYKEKQDASQSFLLKSVASFYNLCDEFGMTDEEISVHS